MKTMTCQQLGGTCDLAHHGATADDVIKAQDRHLREAVTGGDTAHEEALAAMKRDGDAPSRGWDGIAM